MTSSRFLSAVAFAALALLAACGGGEASDDGANGATLASSADGSADTLNGGIGGSGANRLNGGIGGSGANKLNGGIGGSGANKLSAGGSVASQIQSVSPDPGCGLANVVVTVVGVRANPNGSADATSDGWVDVTLPGPVRVDLLALAAGGALPVDLGALPDGSYRQLRLLLATDDANAPLADAVVTVDGTEAALAVPDAAQGGLPLAVAMTIAGGQVSASTRDLAVCKAVTNNAGAYALGPVASVAAQVAASSY